MIWASIPFLYVDPTWAGKLFSAQENQGDGSLAAWKNYGGSKTWPAPQGWDNDQQWHGPPDPVLDTGRYQLTQLTADETSARLQLVSPPDTDRTGIQITRSFSIKAGSSRVQIVLTFTNVTAAPVRWGIWDVVQLQAETRSADGAPTHDPTCFVTTPLNPKSRFSTGFNVMFGSPDNPQWQADPKTGLFTAQYLWEIGKVGIDSTAGWVAFSQGSTQHAFVQQFEVDPNAEYPDDGVTVECWTVGAGQVGNLDFTGSNINHMETEVLGPLQTIQPGASISLPMTWGVCRCDGPIVDVQPGGCTARPLTATVVDDSLHVTGGFGVFDAGKLVLRGLSAQGDLLWQHELGPVDPLTAVTVDHFVPLSPISHNFELLVQATGSDDEFLLASTGQS